MLENPLLPYDWKSFFLSLEKGERISEITCWQVKGPYHLYPDDEWALLDGGIEFRFSNAEYFSIAFDANLAVIAIARERFSDRSESENARRVELPLAWPIGKEIISISVDWKWIENIEEERVYIPGSLNIEFENASPLFLLVAEQDINDDGLLEALNPMYPFSVAIATSQKGVESIRKLEIRWKD